MTTLYLSIVPGKGRWHLMIASGIAGTRRTQRELIKPARALARKHRLELVCHGRDGRIRWRDSHGYDSPKRKG